MLCHVSIKVYNLLHRTWCGVHPTGELDLQLQSPPLPAVLGSPHGSGRGDEGSAAPESPRLWPPLWARAHAGGAPNLAPELPAGGAALHAVAGADAAAAGTPAALQLEEEEEEEGRQVRCLWNAVDLCGKIAAATVCGKSACSNCHFCSAAMS